MLDSVRRMVMEFKDEPYILLWSWAMKIITASLERGQKTGGVFQICQSGRQDDQILDPNHPWRSAMAILCIWINSRNTPRMSISLPRTSTAEIMGSGRFGSRFLMPRQAGFLLPNMVARLTRNTSPWSRPKRPRRNIIAGIGMISR